MSIGLLTGRPRLSLVPLLAAGVVAVVLTGCGKGDQEEVAAQQKPLAMVPGAALDSAVVDTGAIPAVESLDGAGTLPGSEGVSEVPATDKQAVPHESAALKAVPAESEVPADESVTRPATSVSSGDGSFGLQLGSFTNLANARKQVERISALGYTPVIEESDLGGQIYHRVMLRGVGDMAEASRLGEYIHSEIGIAYLVRRGE